MFLLRLISRLPFRILYLLSDFLFFISYYILRYRRILVYTNLKNSFPEKSDLQLKKISKSFYINLCDYAVETLKLLTISKGELRKRMVFKNPELANEKLKNNQSLIYLASHQFNWEWVLVGGDLAYEGELDFVYQIINNSFFDRVSLIFRTRFGSHAIKRDEVAREAIKRKHITRGIAIMADQYPGHGNDKKYHTQFLNQDTVFFYGVNQLAILTQYPAIYHEVKKIKRGYYEVNLVEIAHPPYDKESNSIIENYVKAVEKNIRECPDGYLWSHHRWKNRHLKQASAQYPPESVAS